jgi:hypothetical protein
MNDQIIQSIKDQFQERSDRGQMKYGTTMDRNDLTVKEWLQHAQEEAMDFVVYLEKLKQLL